MNERPRGSAEILQINNTALARGTCSHFCKPGGFHEKCFLLLRDFVFLIPTEADKWS